jgi:hypothetical protein
MKNKINNTILLSMLVIGFFFPTSINGLISLKLSLIHSFILMFFLFILFIINNLNKKTLLVTLSINLILLYFTTIHLFANSLNFEKISWGSYIPFVCLSLLYPISFLKIKSTEFLNKVFVLINIIIITIGFLIILDFNPVNTFILKYYSMGYQELVFNMLASNKPVSMFGSHSIASMFYYIFFYISFHTFMHTKKKFSLLLAICNLVLIFNLNSVSAYILLAIGISQIFLQLFKRYSFFRIMSIPAAFVIVVSFIITTKDNAMLVFSSQSNGFLGRYATDGALASNIEYITNHLLPVGLWISANLYFTDSGFVVNYLKGSIFLVVAIYLGVFLLLKHNIKNKTTVLTLFVIFCLFEIGYPILSFTRMLYFIPFIITYLHQLESNSQNKNPIRL